MSCIPPFKCRRRRTVLASSWLSVLAVLVLLWFYLYTFDYGSDQRELPAAIQFVANDGKPGLDHPDNADRAKPTTTAATPPAMTTKERPRPTATEPAVKLRQGTYIGTTLLASPRLPKSIEAFRGVPYAQDTGGQNRFRPPQPLPESTETFDAVAWGKICPADGVVRRNMSEDCLNANIYRPAGLVDKDGYERTGDQGAARKRPRLPVVVYVHGGGFNTGHGAERNMATFIAFAEAPMVAVNFNYRVGPLGFLPSDVTAREGLLNLGLRDQQMLLEWVRDNIEAFGGDPGNVTLMGLSAGAHSIGHHIMHYSRSSKPAPFARAILESGATTARAVFYPTHPRHLVQFREFLIAAGAGGVPESEIFPYLRTLPLKTIVRAGKVVWDKYSANVTWPFQPVIDGPNPLANSSIPDAPALPPLIPDLPINSWRSGQHLRIPIITGFNTNEGTVFIPPKANTAAEFRAFFQTLIPSLTSADLDKLEALYPDPVTNPSASPYTKVPRGMGKQWARLDAAYAHYAYICPVLQTAHFMSLASGGASSNVYVYQYAATAAHGTANHADEAPVAAHDLADLGGGVPGLEAVAREMHGAFARFVACVAGSGSPNEGNANGEKGLPWPAFVSPFTTAATAGSGAGAGKIMVFGEGNDERSGGRHRGVPAQVREMTELEKEACRFWWERIGLSQGFGRREPEALKKQGGAKL
ncbi:83423bf8-f901-4448-9fc8-c6791e5d754a [Thermothielavioides terrestris]|uniref:Carboxylic ester hydrolase n=1 Tax=Thermothielavioides terrestris TaxID=2587410 RepID=A0A446BYY0_9PEZI|nr:83423bf8-f901-4448-9fc8-c6791e5d754a [Thermothielavioides terrestris]